MSKTNWAMVIIVTLVVAVIASVATLAVTGNTIKVSGTTLTGPSWRPKATTTTADVYTKAEVDTMFKRLGAAAYWGNITNSDYYNLKNLQNSASNVINQGVLNMLNNKCIINNPAGEFTNGSFIIGSSICKKYNKDYNKNTACIFAETAIGSTDMISQVIPCNSDINVSVWAHVMCCSP